MDKYIGVPPWWLLRQSSKPPNELLRTQCGTNAVIIARENHHIQSGLMPWWNWRSVSTNQTESLDLYDKYMINSVTMCQLLSHCQPMGMSIALKFQNKHTHTEIEVKWAKLLNQEFPDWHHRCVCVLSIPKEIYLAATQLPRIISGMNCRLYVRPVQVVRRQVFWAGPGAEILRFIWRRWQLINRSPLCYPRKATRGKVSTTKTTKEQRNQLKTNIWNIMKYPASSTSMQLPGCW